MCFGGGPEYSIAQREAILRSNEIDKLLMEQAQAERSGARILLLGTGDSGKSTILKQLKIIYGSDYTEQERASFRPILIGNVVQCAKSLVAAMEHLSISYSGSLEKEIDLIKRASDKYTVTDCHAEEGFLEAVKVFWADAGVQQCFSRAREFQILDSCPFLMERLDNIFSQNYLPPNDVILASRVVTKMVSETRLKMKDMPVRIFDVGGQRKERSKWAAYFDDCHCIIFVAALSAFDQVLEDDGNTNRLVDSLFVFEVICNHVLFEDIPIVLFLNKIDLFKKKYKISPISNFFPEYTGGDSLTAACGFFEQIFSDKRKNPDRPLFVHVTWATDTNQTKKILETVYESVINSNLQAMGLM